MVDQYRIVEGGAYLEVPITERFMNRMKSHNIDWTSFVAKTLLEKLRELERLG